MSLKVLIVDDEKSIVDALQRALSSLQIKMTAAYNGQQALESIKKSPPDILVTDLRMPRMGGMELIQKTAKNNPNMQIIVITGHGTIDDAVTAMKEGAYDFITKPFKKQQIMAVVKRASEKVILLKENLALKEKLKNERQKGVEWGKNRVFRDLVERSAQAAQSDATILIMGESGTGKEVLANHIYENSLRQDKPFIKINCAAIPDTLLEAELFGYKKGSFTGAVEDRKGKFLEAEGGTLFLDEIGEVPLSVQVKLLRALQNGEINPVGGAAAKVDVRIITATNQKLREKVQKGEFREDLFYRLNVIPLYIPPLRDRPEDLTTFFSFFIQKYCKKNKRENLTVSADALRLIEQYSWPGNVRELENATERAVILCRNHQITPEDLPPELSQTSNQELNVQVGNGMTMEEIERHIINNTLKKFNGDKNRTAEALGISLRTVYRKLDAIHETI